MGLARGFQGDGPSQARTQPATSVTRRLVYSLALIPIVPAVSVIGSSLAATYLPLLALGELRWFHLFFSVLWVVATILLWRTVVLWTLGRKWLTAMVSMIPFVQVLYGQPLWNISASGCVDLRPEMLRIAQHEIGISVWTWLAVWVWWAWEKKRMKSGATKHQGKAIRMTPNARRVVASIATIPFLFATFLIAYVVFQEPLKPSEPTPQALAVTTPVMTALWILIWRGAVAWDRAVVLRTACVGLVLLGLPVAVQLLVWPVVSDVLAVVAGCLPLIGWGLWMVVTIRVWPTVPGADTSDGRMPRCPQCAYLLTGLYATRCPECGAEPTLDELWCVNIGSL